MSPGLRAFVAFVITGVICETATYVAWLLGANDTVFELLLWLGIAVLAWIAFEVQDRAWKRKEHS